MPPVYAYLFIIKIYAYTTLLICYINYKTYMKIEIRKG